jgi:hypothetical protein
MLLKDKMTYLHTYIFVFKPFFQKAAPGVARFFWVQHTKTGKFTQNGKKDQMAIKWTKLL